MSEETMASYNKELEASFRKIEEGDIIEAFTMEEICGAIKDCHNLKAPGPDGFNFSFIKKVWPFR